MGYYEQNLALYRHTGRNSRCILMTFKQIFFLTLYQNLRQNSFVKVCHNVEPEAVVIMNSPSPIKICQSIWYFNWSVTHVWCFANILCPLESIDLLSYTFHSNVGIFHCNWTSYLLIIQSISIESYKHWEGVKLIIVDTSIPHFHFPVERSHSIIVNKYSW